MENFLVTYDSYRLDSYCFYKLLIVEKDAESAREQFKDYLFEVVKCPYDIASRIAKDAKVEPTKQKVFLIESLQRNAV